MSAPGFFDDLAPRSPPPPPPPAATGPNGPSRWALQGGQAMLSGAARSVGLVGDLQNALTGLLDRYIGDPIFGPRPAGAPAPPDFSGDANVRRLEAIGLANRPELAPRDTGERYFTSAMEGLGGSLPFGGAGNIRTLMAGTVAGPGAQLGRELTAGTAMEPWAALAGGTAGAMVGQGLGGMASRAMNAVRGAQTPVARAFETAEVTPRLVGDVSQRPAAQAMQAAAAQMPGGTTRVRDAAQATVDDFRRSMQNTAAMLGTAATPEQAGQRLQAAANTWLGNWRTQERGLWNNLRLHLPDDTRIAFNNTERVLADLQTRMRDNPDLAQALSSDQFRRIRDAIAGGPQQLRAETMRAFRSAVGQMREPGLVNNIAQAEVRALYGAITDDIRAGLRLARDPAQAIAAFDRANRFSSAGHRVMDNIIEPMVGGGGQRFTPAQTFNWVMQNSSARAGGGARLNAVRQVVDDPQLATPGTFGNVGAAWLGPRAEAVAGGGVTPVGVARDITALAPEARTALFQGQAGPRVDALRDVGNALRASSRFANSSNTGGAINYANMLTHLTGGALGAATGGALGFPAGGGALGMLSAPLAGRLAAALTTARPAIAYAGAQQVPQLTRQQLMQLAPLLSPDARAALLFEPLPARR